MNHENTRKLMMEERKSCKGRGDENAKEIRVTPPQKPHHGLYNQGATCYLNSVLQVLCMTTEFNDRLDPEQQTDLQLRQIFDDLKKRTCGTENITTRFGIKDVYHQRDAAECLLEILRQVSTKASKVFQGQLRETTRCYKDHMINDETKPFRTLQLSLNNTRDSTYSLESSFERIFQETPYPGNYMVYCNKCDHHTEAIRGCKMVEAPQILILQIFVTPSQFKSDCCVEVPCELQLKNKTYKLYGMVNHMDSRRDGRYTATVLSEDNTWYECHDERVSKVEDQLFAEDRTFSSKTVYLLTYRATELKMFCKTRLNEEDEVEMRSDDEVLNHQTEGEEGNTEENSKSDELNDAQKHPKHSKHDKKIQAHDTTYSEESSFERIVNTKSFPGDNKAHCDKKMNATSISAKKVITEHKVELINCLMVDHSFILQHAHAKHVIRDDQYLKIKKRSPSTPQETVIDLIDDVIFNGQESCTRFLEVLKLPDVRSTYPQLKEIMNKIQLSGSGDNA